MDKFFKLKENHTTVRTEILAGITTFMAMAYILMVNAGMFGDLGEGMYNAVYIATAISAVIGTLLIGLMAKLPLAQASGMGLNAFFVYTVCFGMGFSYANALVMVLVDGIVFILLTVTGLRRIIFEAIPKSLPASACSSPFWGCRTPVWSSTTIRRWSTSIPSTSFSATSRGRTSCRC